MQQRILSGMRPTGKLHLGHLVGALDNWVKLQETYDCYFMVADWHALMGEYENPKAMREAGIDNVVDFLAAGIDPEKSTLFVQSDVPQHLELSMIFSCLTPLGWLERCPTYKEQLREVTTRDLNTYAFLGYPVLQAADIMLYKAHKVPVGEDQLPHLELTREIVRRFNSMYTTDMFPEPEAILTRTPRLLGIDGRKMSKSYNNAINLSDSDDEIRKKVSMMITDPQRIKLADPGHPDVCNVFAYYGTFLTEMGADVRDWCTNAKIGCTECKKRCAAGLIEKLAPFHAKREEFVRDTKRVEKILATGREKAVASASQTVAEAREAMHL
ncbi:MAG TPA: tryptophan--tRNA ligase [Candidatus Omnitrophota bacterium]|nr:tryptophan--tRNA ligase [Candidatus Omnitrophota bacterium]